MLRYIYNHQNEDGGWGLHIEGHSTMFCTTFNYICIHILGEKLDNGYQGDACARARKWILDHGGATHIPSWGKTWLSILGLFNWSGVNPMPPEFWTLPSLLPMYPAKMWSYCRLVYMPMSYLYGRQFVGPITPLILQLREELFTQPYHQINWNKARHLCAKEDPYYPHHFVQNLLWDGLYMFIEPLLKCWPLNNLVREKALQITMKHIHYEDENSRYIDNGCVEKALFMLACWLEDPNGDSFKKHLARIPDYLWVSEDGMTVQRLGSQSWDAGLAIQALLATNLVDEVLHQEISGMYRHISKGSWTFSDHDNGWEISDGTAEALKCCLLLSLLPPEIVGEKLDAESLFDSINLLLSLQFLNPVEIFEGIVVEHEYIECTGSAIGALVLFMKLYPEHRTKEIENSIVSAIWFLENTQEDNGSWYGTWGVCFIYGTYFALSGLIEAGKTYTNCTAIYKAVKFLLATQRDDGGWGESYLSCSRKIYIPLEGNRSMLYKHHGLSWLLFALARRKETQLLSMMQQNY